MNASTLVAAALALTIGPSSAPDDDARFSDQMVTSPWKGAGGAKGEYRVVNEGMGARPSGYGMEHEPGEVAEYHLFVPSGLKKGERYPLLIIYHGGRDGQSGAKLCRAWARASTKRHPFIVLSPNMYTMDAYDQLIEEGVVPIDERRVFVVGFSSGGRGLGAAARKQAESNGRFRAAALVAASTTLRSSGIESTQGQFVVMCGEWETPERSRDAHLGTIRRLCRKNAVELRASLPFVRYIEIESMGHRVNRPEHHAVVHNLIAATERYEPRLSIKKFDPALETLVTLARLGRYVEVLDEIERLDGDTDPKRSRAYEPVRRKVASAVQDWAAESVKRLAKLSGKSDHLEVTAALDLQVELRAVLERYETIGRPEERASLTAKLDGAERLALELEARDTYRAAVAHADVADVRDALLALRESHAGTEFGTNRTREMLLALEGGE